MNKAIDTTVRNFMTDNGDRPNKQNKKVSNEKDVSSLEQDL
jgi:hypothetical protein